MNNCSEKSFKTQKRLLIYMIDLSLFHHSSQMSELMILKGEKVSLKRENNKRKICWSQFQTKVQILNTKSS